MDTSYRDRILVVDHNSIFRESLAQRLRAAGHDVATSGTGEHAFLMLRDWQHPIDWLYTCASLPILIDGWILADEYHDAHPTRPAVIAAPEARPLHQGDIVLAQASPTVVLKIICRLIEQSRYHHRQLGSALGMSSMPHRGRAPAVSLPNAANVVQHPVVMGGF
jgi:CheY-like chemotaxis protein